MLNSIKKEKILKILTYLKVILLMLIMTIFVVQLIDSVEYDWLNPYLFILIGITFSVLIASSFLKNPKRNHQIMIIYTAVTIFLFVFIITGLYEYILEITNEYKFYIYILLGVTFVLTVAMYILSFTFFKNEVKEKDDFEEESNNSEDS